MQKKTPPRTRSLVGRINHKKQSIRKKWQNQIKIAAKKLNDNINKAKQIYLYSIYIYLYMLYK